MAYEETKNECAHARGARNSKSNSGESASCKSGKALSRFRLEVQQDQKGRRALQEARHTSWPAEIVQCIGEITIRLPGRIVSLERGLYEIQLRVLQKRLGS